MTELKNWKELGEEVDKILATYEDTETRDKVLRLAQAFTEFVPIIKRLGLSEDDLKDIRVLIAQKIDRLFL